MEELECKTGEEHVFSLVYASAMTDSQFEKSFDSNTSVTKESILSKYFIPERYFRNFYYSKEDIKLLEIILISSGNSYFACMGNYRLRGKLQHGQLKYFIYGMGIESSSHTSD